MTYKIQVGYDDNGKWAWRDISLGDGDTELFANEDEANIFKDYLDETYIYDKELRVIKINDLDSA